MREALRAISENRTGIVMVVDEQNRLLGTLTDGDLRRALLGGKELGTPVADLVKTREESAPPFVTAGLQSDHATLLALMIERVVKQIPLLDPDGKVADLVTLDDLLPEEVVPLRAVIMAGGFGQRLRPLTEKLPKPMLPVGEKPVMELIIGQLRTSGIHKVNVTTHFEPGQNSRLFRRRPGLRCRS